MGYGPMEVAIALALYDFNVPAAARAKRLEAALPGEDVDLMAVTAILHSDAISFATRLHPNVAETYMRFALEAYGAEAKRRAQVAGFGRAHGLGEEAGEQDVSAEAR